jgi:hypothetical protein
MNRLAITLACWGASTMVHGQFSGTTNVNGALPAGIIVTNSPGSYTVTGGGADYWDRSDQFYFAYEAKGGDFDVRVRVESLAASDYWAKAGLMVRESAAPDSRMVVSYVAPATGANITRVMHRTGIAGNLAGLNGGQNENGTGSPSYPNAWLRLQRSGHRFFGYRSSDGSNWIVQTALDTTGWERGLRATSFTNLASVGLAVASHVQGTSATAQFRDYANSPAVMPGLAAAPQHTSSETGGTVSLQVGPTGQGPFTYEWRRAGVLIPGATGPSLTLSNLSASDAGDYFATVRNGAGSVACGAATLTVFPAGSATAVVPASVIRRSIGPLGPGRYADANRTGALAVDSVGNIYVTAATATATNKRDMLTAKYDAAGQVQWSAQYDGPAHGDDAPQGIAVDGSGNVYVAGTSAGGASGTDFVVVKYSTAGTQAWAMRYNGPANSDDNCVGLGLDGTGSLYVAGSSLGSGTFWDFAVVKYGAGGTQQWVARYSNAGNLNDTVQGVAVDSAGNSYLTGFSYTGPNYYNWDFTTVKFNSAGTQQWVRNYNGPPDFYDYGRAIGVDGAGNVCVAGDSLSDGSNYDFAVVKYSSIGTQQWVARFDTVAGANGRFDAVRALAVDATGGVIVTGRGNGDATSVDFVTVKYSSAGTFQWAQRYHGDGDFDEPQAVATDSAGGVYVAGTSWNGAASQTDLVLVKYDASGAAQWVRKFDGSSQGCENVLGARALVVGTNGNAHLAGTSAAADGATDLVVVKYAANPSLPIIVQQPRSRAVPAGTNLTLSVAVGDLAGTTFQWRFNGTNLAGATNAELILASVDLQTAGGYAVVISNAAGSVLSDEAAVSIVAAPAAPGTGSGLKGDYFDNSDFTSLRLTRVDPGVNFDWGDGTPDPLLGADTFSVRWTGQVQPRVTGRHQFFLVSDDGARLWVNDKLVVDRFVDQPPAEYGGAIDLVAGQRYDVKLEYYENGGGANMGLMWAAAGQPLEWVPAPQLYDGTGPVITFQPVSQSAAVGSTVSFSVTATGTAPLFYQWRRDGVPITGATTTSLVLSNVQMSASGGYDVVVSNTYGSVTSIAASLIVGEPAIILVQPQTQTALAGDPVTFSIALAGTPPFGCGWRINGSTVTNVQSFDGFSSLVLANISPANHSNRIDVVVSNAFRAAFLSAQAFLFVLAPPSLTASPVSTNVFLGADVTFCVTAAGGGLRYQWLRNGASIPGATNACLTIPSVQLEDGGSYAVVVANQAGAVTSLPAVLDLELPVVVPGDRFADRTPLLDPAGSIGHTNQLATLEPGEPAHAGKPGGHSVWYSWTPPAKGVARFRTVGSTFDTLLAVYTGTNVATLTPVASDEDDGGFLTSEVVFNVEPGVEYNIAVDGYSGESGKFVLDWSFEASLDPLPVITSQPAGDTVAAGSDFTFSVTAAGAGLTYQWLFFSNILAGATGPAFTVTNVQAEDVGLYSVRVNSGLRTIMSTRALLEIGTQSGARSHDKVQDLPLEQGAGFRVGPRLAAAPVFGGFVPVTLGSLGQQVMNNTDSGTSSTEPTHGGVIGGASRWFGLRPEANAVLVVDTVGSQIDTVIAVYRGSTNYTDPFTFWGSLAAVASDDNGAPDGVRSQVAFNARRDTNYMVAVDGVNGAQGVIVLNWRLITPTLLPQSANFQFLRPKADVLLAAVPTNVPAGWRFQWRLNGMNVSGATNRQFILPELQFNDGGDYSVTLFDGSLSWLSPGARIVVNELAYGWRVGAGPPQFALSGRSSHRLRLDTTTNWADWTPLYTTGGPGIAYDVVDPNSVLRPKTFYRLTPLP